MNSVEGAEVELNISLTYSYPEYMYDFLLLFVSFESLNGVYSGPQVLIADCRKL
jgi:hypothetical protein